MIKYNFICDLEFTNLNPTNGQIIECALLVTDLNLNVVNQFYAQIRPELINHVTWTTAAQNVHGITPEMAMQFPFSRYQFCMALLNFLAPYYYECRETQPFVCHAIDYAFKDSWPMIDFHFLDWAFRYENLEYSFWKIIEQQNVLSTIAMAKKAGLFGRKISIDKNGRKSNRKTYGLKPLCDIIGFDLDHHKAMSDAYGCLEVYKYCKQNNSGGLI